MKLPKTLIIGKSEWSVVMLKEIDKPLKDGTITWGYCDEAKQQIEILSRLKTRPRLRTFIHEVMHAFEDEYGLEIEHKLLDKIATAFADLILVNFT